MVACARAVILLKYGERVALVWFREASIGRSPRKVCNEQSRIIDMVYCSRRAENIDDPVILCAFFSRDANNDRVSMIWRLYRIGLN